MSDLFQPNVPNDYRIFNKQQVDGTYRPLSEFFDPEPTVEFDPATMTRATFEDVQNMMDKLWGSGARDQYKMIAPREDGELLDLTQIERNDG